LVINIISVGKPEKRISENIDYYIKKCSNYNKIIHLPIKDVRIKNNTEKVSEEENKILKSITEGYICVLDERGKSFNTTTFSSFLKTRIESSKDIYFIIGGAFGLGKKVFDKADILIRISDMVIQHDIALLVLLEQIYRGLTIIKGIPYHK